MNEGRQIDENEVKSLILKHNLDQSERLYRTVIWWVGVVFTAAAIFTGFTTYESKRETRNAIGEMEERFKVLSADLGREPELTFHEGTTPVTKYIVRPTRPGEASYSFENLRIVNTGNRIAELMSMKLYFTSQVDEVKTWEPRGGWHEETSHLAEFPFTMYYDHLRNLSPKDGWYFPVKELLGTSGGERGLIEIFYGTEEPARIEFSLDESSVRDE